MKCLIEVKDEHLEANYRNLIQNKKTNRQVQFLTNMSKGHFHFLALVY